MLHLTDQMVKCICEEQRTPAYVFDIDSIKERIGWIRRVLDNDAGIHICYAMKANPFLIGEIDSIVDNFEVCSPGELSVCKKNSIAPEKIVLSGVYKQYEDVMDSMEYGVRVFTAESVLQLELLQACAGKKGLEIEVYLRLTSGNQFGIDINNIKDILQNKNSYTNIRFVGIQYYSGTQKKLKKISEEFPEIVGISMELEKQFGIDFPGLEYGPGWGVDYFGKSLDEEELLAESARIFHLYGKDYLLTLEIGRFLAAECGSYITKVVDILLTAE